MKRYSGWGGRPGNERGATLVLVAAMLVALLAFAALAVDIGYLMVSRNELQNAADASSLAGAALLFPASSGPNWAAAEAQATTEIGFNKSWNVALVNGQVQSGYWNLTGSPPVLQAKGIVPGPSDAPAVEVTINRSPGNNGGPINFIFAPIIGITSSPVSARAVAVTSYPNTVGPGTLLPVAIGKCLYDNYWDTATNSPRLNPATGLPYVFRITSGYHVPIPSCEGGDWSSFLDLSNNVTTIRDLIDGGNPAAVSIGDDIWVSPGTKNALYGDVPVGTDVLLPIVTNITPHGWSTVVGFGAFHIDASVGGSGHYIEGHFIKDYKVPVGSGGGPYYGAYTPPTLAQ